MTATPIPMPILAPWERPDDDDEEEEDEDVGVTVAVPPELDEAVEVDEPPGVGSDVPEGVVVESPQVTGP